MWLLPFSIVVLTLIVAIPMSKYIAWIMDGKYRPWAFFRWFERRLDTGPMNWKQYTAALLLSNTVLFVWGFIVLSLQPVMPLNDLHRGMLFPTTIFHSVASFMTNTNLQHYSGDQHFSNIGLILIGIFAFDSYFVRSVLPIAFRR
jgi:K+-transporting ATPase ATPase A chain